MSKRPSQLQFPAATAALYWVGSWVSCPGCVWNSGAVGNEIQKEYYLPNLISGKWSGTMNLTEPHAGSDLSSIKTKAIEKDKKFLIKGTKIYITHGDQDMSDNIIHLVLAKLPNAPEGVRGISLFLVPKYYLNENF